MHSIPADPGHQTDADISDQTAEHDADVPPARATATHEPAEPIDAVAGHLESAGVMARPLRRVLALLADEAQSLENLIRVPAVPRRTVEQLLGAAGSDVETVGGTYRLAHSAIRRYRDRFALDMLDSSEVAEPSSAEMLERIRGFVATGPEPATWLDHVTATPETVLRRAQWLRDNFDLSHARVLCLGDHDLTSLAVCMVEPSATVTVVDLDERVLTHIDNVAAEHGFNVHTLHTDLRFGLPPGVHDEADLVVTDPPYTPEGVGLFTARAAECMAGANSRIVLSYGFSERSPALGHNVQQELLRLGWVFESIVPAFNRYYGAQAIGSASDLYVCQPTAQTRKLSGRRDAGIYTHGPQSVETATQAPSEQFVATIAGITRTSVDTMRKPGWHRPIRTSEPVPVFDLRADPGPWLLRMLLACNTERAAFLVGNRHPDITSEHGQSALADLVAAKFRLRFHRSSPDSTHAVVLAEPATSESGVAHHLLRRAHGKVGNIWREALIAHAQADGSMLNKREATEQVAGLVQDSTDLQHRLIDLPRHRISSIVHAQP